MDGQGYTLEKGQRIAEFVIEDVLGAGSFGITYRALDSELGRRVAIKEFFPREIAHRDSSGTLMPSGTRAEATYSWALERFIDEARTLAKFSHPNIVGVIRLIPALHGTAYIVMEYVEGITLEEAIERDGPPLRDDVLAITQQLLNGCQAIHAINILHRDIKPSNIMLRRTQLSGGSGPVVTPVLIDFGSARDLALQAQGFSAVVTHGYSPSEQYSRDRKQTEATDIYALACTIYNMLTGVEPRFVGERVGLAEALEPVAAERAAQFGKKFIEAVNRGAKLEASARPQTIEQWRPMFGFEDRESGGGGRPGGLHLGRRQMLIGGGVAAAAVVAGGSAWLLHGEGGASSFAAPLQFGWQKPLGLVGPDPFVQIAAIDQGAILAAHAMGGDTLPRMRALRLNGEGDVTSEWLDDAADGEAIAILPAKDGGAFVGGRVGGKATLVRLGPGWKPVWRNDQTPGRITAVLKSEKGVVVGIEGIDTGGSQIVALDEAGKLVWRIAIDKAKDETIQRMIALKKGGYAVLGWGVQSRETAQGTLNENYAWIALVDAQGNSRNRPQSNGLGAASGWAIAEVGDTIYVAGRTSDGRPDSPSLLFLWAVDGSGAVKWQRWDYPASPSSGRALAAASNDLYVGGWSGSPLKTRVAQVGPKGDLNWDQVKGMGAQSAIIDLSLRGDRTGFAIATVPSSADRNQLILVQIA